MLKQYWKRIAASAVLLGAITWLLFTYIRFPWQRIHAEDAIPKHAALVIQVSDATKITELVQKNNYQTSLLRWRIADKMAEDMLLLKAFYGNENPIQKVPFWATLLNSSTDELDYLYIFDTEWHKIDLQKQLSKIDGSHVKQHTYKGSTFFTVYAKDNRSFHLVAYENVIIASRSAVLVEESVSQINNKNNSILLDSDWKQVTNTLEATPVNGARIYFNLTESAPLLSGFLDDTKKADFKLFCDRITWAGFDIEPNADGIKIKGALVPNGEKRFLSIMSSQKLEEKSEINNVLPNNVAAMSYIGTRDFQHKYSQLSLGESPAFGHYFAPFLGNEQALIMTESYGTDTEATPYAIFKIADEALAKKKIAQLKTDGALIQTLSYMTYQIGQVSTQGIVQPFWGTTFQSFSNPYFAVVDKFVVFATSESGIKTFIDNYNVSHTLTNDISYQQYYKKVDSTKGNFYTYLNFNFLKNTLKTYLSPTAFAQIDEQTGACFSDMPRIGLRLSANENGYTFDGVWEREKKMKVAENNTPGTLSLWKYALENNAATQPFVVRHPQTKENEVLIQDVDNQVYVINRQGAVRWKRKLSKRIISEIQQIDYFENNNLYYVFNTEDDIFILDKDGKDISNFPIQLKSKATNGLLTIDFEGTKKYEFFIACANGNFYGFEKSGKPLSGWNPVLGVGVVRHPFLHFQNGGKDFIVAITERGMLHILRRNGGDRFSSQNFNAPFLSPPSFQADRYSQRIVACDARGRVHNINMEGVEFPLLLSSGPGTRFTFADVIGDLRKDYIAISNKKLVCHGYEDQDFLKKYAYVFPDVQDDVFSVQHIKKNKFLIGTVSKSAKLIYLLEGAKLYPTFPIPGTTRFALTDFYDDGNSVLIVGNEKDVCAYKVM
jgi:hypothetical protein